MARKIRLATLWNPDLGRSSEGPARGPCESTAFEPWPAAVPLAFFLMSDPVCRSAAYPSRGAGRGGAGRCAVTTCDPSPHPVSGLGPPGFRRLISFPPPENFCPCSPTQTPQRPSTHTVVQALALLRAGGRKPGRSRRERGGPWGPCSSVRRSWSRVRSARRG